MTDSQKKEILTEEKNEKKTDPAFVGQYFEAVGRRKVAIARVRLFKTRENKILINEIDYKEYFPKDEFQRVLLEPLKVSGLLDSVSINIKVRGGGKHGQIDAIRLGIARAILKINPDFRLTFKPLKMLRRDPRQKERKKPGLKRARRAPQWTKR